MVSATTIPSGGGTVTSVGMTLPTGLAVTGSPVTTSGTLAVSMASGYSIPTTASQTNWDTAYSNRITSLTTTGSSGSATLTGNTLNVPTYTLSGLGGLSTSTAASTYAPISSPTFTGTVTLPSTSSIGSVSSTEIGYVDGVTSAIQTQIDAKADKSLGAYKMRANNTNATANGTEQVFKAIAQQAYGGTITFTASSNPTGTPDQTYSWMQIGNMVTLSLSATYSGAGSGVTQCVIPLPADMPNPIKPTGRTASSEKLYVANGQMMATTTGTTASAFSSYLRSNSTNTGYEFVITMSSGSYKVIDLTCTYPVN